VTSRRSASWNSLTKPLNGELAYFHCYNPRGESLSELVAVIGLRWPIEECFEAAKQ
jgi:SRSO17 transposase